MPTPHKRGEEAVFLQTADVCLAPGPPRGAAAHGMLPSPTKGPLPFFPMRVPPPDFDSAALRSAPDAHFAPAPADGVLPEGFYSTTNLPTWVKADGHWSMPREPRMDA